jgi:hypothetical protein
MLAEGTKWMKTSLKPSEGDVLIFSSILEVVSGNGYANE